MVNICMSINILPCITHLYTHTLCCSHTPNPPSPITPHSIAPMSRYFIFSELVDWAKAWPFSVSTSRSLGQVKHWFHFVFLEVKPDGSSSKTRTKSHPILIRDTGQWKSKPFQTFFTLCTLTHILLLPLSTHTHVARPTIFVFHVSCLSFVSFPCPRSRSAFYNWNLSQEVSPTTTG